MAPQTKRRNRESRPQCRFNVETVNDLDRYRKTTRRYGYRDLSSFMRALMEAAEKGDTSTGTIKVPIEFRPVNQAA